MERNIWIVGIIVVFLSVLVISGCVKQEEKTFLDFVNKLNLETSYPIDVYTSDAGGGGERRSSETTEIESIKLKETANEIKNIKMVGSFKAENRNCYYSYSSKGPDYLVCFADNKIVNYVKKYGPSYSRWNALGYEFDIRRSTILNSISNLKECNVDSDCTLTSSGVCDQTNQTRKCTIISAACDPGCRTSINEEHFLIWDFVPLIEDQCIPDKCADYKLKEYYKASCVNNICESKIVK